MATLRVGYTVPVEVVVNLDTGEVERVVVVDESVELDRDDFNPQGKAVHTMNYETVTDAELTSQAVEVAENGMWPAWEFGW